jgi:hypothetical protein
MQKFAEVPTVLLLPTLQYSHQSPTIVMSGSIAGNVIFEGFGLKAVRVCVQRLVLTSRAETICRGRRAVFRSAVFVSRS